jgi:tryptophan halogenase
MPFFLDIDPEDIPAYTESTAMKHGWVWKIPLQHRYGCGYVFDSNYITDEEARKEIVDFLGEEPAEWPRDTSIKFEPGYFKTPWVNNCLAIGLSGGFIEPLEATSLWATVMSLREAFKDTQFIVSPNKNYSEEFNAHMSALNEYIFRFVYAHYRGGRTDTDFWKHYQDPENMPESLKTLMEPWKYRQMTYREFRSDLFRAESWAQVYAGLGLSDVDIAKKSYNSNHMPDDIEPYYGQYLEANKEVVEACVPHVQILEDLKNAPDILPAQ